jgi:hypothetical protein
MAGRCAEAAEGLVKLSDVLCVIAPRGRNHQHPRMIFSRLIEDVLLEREIPGLCEEAAAADRDDVRHRPD